MSLFATYICIKHALNLESTRLRTNDATLIPIIKSRWVRMYIFVFSTTKNLTSMILQALDYLNPLIQISSVIHKLIDNWHDG